MGLVFLSTVIIIGLVVSGNTTGSQLAENATLSGCRSATVARLNNARVANDHAQNAAIQIGVDAATGEITGLTPTLAQVQASRQAVVTADELLTQAERQYQEEYELSNKDPDRFIKECRARGDI